MALIPEVECLIPRIRHVSETNSSSDSGVEANVSSSSSLESVRLSSPQGSEDSGDSTPKIYSSTSHSLSPANAASIPAQGNFYHPNTVDQIPIKNLSVSSSNETLTEERVSRNDRICLTEIQNKQGIDLYKNYRYNSVCLTNREAAHSDTRISASASKQVHNLKFPGLPTERDFTSKNRVPLIHEFIPCRRHRLSSEYFCWSCAEDGCQKCVAERHENHRYYKSITCYNLLTREDEIIGQMEVCLRSLKNTCSRFKHFHDTLLLGVIDWQKKIGTRVNIKLAQIQLESAQHLKNLHSIETEAEGEFTSFRRMMNGLRRLYHSGFLTEIHDNANPIRRSLINLECINTRTIEAITNAILSESGGRSILSDIIQTSGMEMLTHTPLSHLEKMGPWKNAMKRGPKSDILKCSPDTQAPDIPAVLEPLFCCGVPSPTICDSFTFARMDPITPAPARTHWDSSWPTEQDQVQMAHFDAVSRLLSPEPLWPEVNKFDRKWEPRTPQPKPSTSSWIPHTPQPRLPQFAEQSAEPPSRRSQSLVALWEQIEQPAPSVPKPLLPLPSTPKQEKSQVQLPKALQPIAVADKAFEIGYHISRNYSQIKTPVVKIEGRGEKDANQLCRPWGVCCDKKNHIYVADRSKDRIVVFSTDGTFIHSFGVKGDRPGEFNRPAGLAFDCEGRLVVADKDNHRIQVFSSDGEYLFHFGRYGNQHGEFFYPWDVACSSNGHIAVTDTRNHRVQIFTHSGVFIRKYGWESRPSMLRELDSPRGVIFIKDNVLLVTDFNNHRIIQITFGDRVCMGQFNKTNHPKAVLNRPQGLTMDAEGNILVCDSKNDRVVIFSPEGEFMGDFGRHGKEDGQFDRAVDITVAPDGKIAVIDLGHNRVQIF